MTKINEELDVLDIEQMKHDELIKERRLKSEKKNSNRKKEDSNPQGTVGSINILRGLASINLVCSVIGAIFIWSTMGTIKVPYTYTTGFYTETNPFGIGLGFGLLVEGLIVSVFFLVVCVVAENIIEIRKNTQR